MAQRGVITLPKSLRESYGLEPGDTLTLLDLDGVLVLKPERAETEAPAGKVAPQWSEGGEK